MLNKLIGILSIKDKQFLLLLLFFSIFISMVEMLGISIIMPFISIATDFSLLESNQYYKFFYTLFGFSTAKDFLVFFGILLIIFYIFRSIVNLFYFYMLNRFSQGRYHVIASRLFANYMGLPYQTFITKNSSNLTKTIITEALHLTNLMRSLLLMLSEIFIVVLLYALMLYVNYQITLILTGVLFLNGLFLTKTISVKIKQAGIIRADLQTKLYESINKSFSNFKFIKLNSNYNDFLKEFKGSSLGYADAYIKATTLQHFPRLFLEAIAFGFIAFIVTYLVWQYDSNIQNELATITMFVLALYRLMPSVNRIMSGYNQILFVQKSLDIIYNDLNEENEELGDEKISFNHSILLSNVSFGYNREKSVLSDVNLEIRKGDKVAFIGESGSGKSTLVDIIVGLYKVESGSIRIDGEELNDTNLKDWRSKVGYIPQNVYLFDGTVAQNIVFAREYNEEKVIKALKQANIYHFLEEEEEGIATKVGEGGVMLSGGQKQRIAIARALYANPEILIFDEGTSALDETTEKKIMDEIYKISQDKTLFIIAHRLSTIDRCQEIYKLNNGKVTNVQ